MHAAIRIDGHYLFLADDRPEYCGGKEQHPNALGATPVTIHRCVKDTDAAFNRAVEAGATPVMPVMDMFWGDRYGLLKDPFGHKWAFASRIRDMTDQEMQKAGDEAMAGDGGVREHESGTRRILIRTGLALDTEDSQRSAT